jgi:hypothetical protein
MSVTMRVTRTPRYLRTGANWYTLGATPFEGCAWEVERNADDRDSGVAAQRTS